MEFWHVWIPLLQNTWVSKLAMQSQSLYVTAGPSGVMDAPQETSITIRTAAHFPVCPPAKLLRALRLQFALGEKSTSFDIMQAQRDVKKSNQSEWVSVHVEVRVCGRGKDRIEKDETFSKRFDFTERACVYWCKMWLWLDIMSLKLDCRTNVAAGKWPRNLNCDRMFTMFISSKTNKYINK